MNKVITSVDDAGRKTVHTCVTEPTEKELRGAATAGANAGYRTGVKAGFQAGYEHGYRIAMRLVSGAFTDAAESRSRGAV
jgi:hypothetical protein